MKKDEVVVKCNADFDFDGMVTPKSITKKDGQIVTIIVIKEQKPYETWSGRAGIKFLCETDLGDIELHYDHRGNIWYIKMSSM
jgi:hypothetical protein